jgi:hypothetical protein
MAFKVSVTISCDSPRCTSEFKCESVGFNHIPKAKSLDEAEQVGWYLRESFAQCPACASKFVNGLSESVAADAGGVPESGPSTQ